MKLPNIFRVRGLPDAWKWIQEVVNGNLDLDNLRWRLLEYETNAAPNAEDVVPHLLGKSPIGFIVLSIDKPGVVYQSGAPSVTELKLKCSVASANVKLVVL